MRSLGADEVAVLAAALILLGAASLAFTHLQGRAHVPVPAGRAVRLAFGVAAWASSLGAILGWSLVLAELALGPLCPIDAWVLAASFALVAPPIGQMNRMLVPAKTVSGRPGEGGSS